MQDRPFIVAEYEKNLLISFTTVPGNIFVVRSSDQGQTWGHAQPVMLLPPEAVLSLNGEPTVDVDRHELVLSYAFSSSDFISNIEGGGSLNIIGVARPKDHGATWTTETAAAVPPGQGVLSVPSLTSDRRGHEYLA